MGYVECTAEQGDCAICSWFAVESVQVDLPIPLSDADRAWYERFLASKTPKV